MSTNTKIQRRNYGIDLLRLIAAFYVITVHIMFQGGLYPSAVPQTYQNYLCSFLLISSYCAVNIFAVISGYVGYSDTRRPVSLSKFLHLWISVVFYSVTICLVYMVLLPGSVSWSDFKTMLFPLRSRLYWYFSAYTLVYFISPYLNDFINCISDRLLKLCFFLIIFVIVPLEYKKELFAMSDGYSAKWLVLLYLIGAIMKKTGICSHIPPVAAVFLIIALDVLLFFKSILAPQVNLSIFNFLFDLAYCYTSPIHLVTAILHVVAFSRFRFHPAVERMIAFAAPAAFFVYIVNVHQTFWAYFMKDRFALWASSSPIGILVRTFAFSAAFVIFVVFADYTRRRLFRLLGIDNGLRRISSFLHDSISG